MRNTYAAPAAKICGDVVRSTLCGKPFGTELAYLFFTPFGGSGLSFGL
jgi:hypothetical protein